MLTNYLKIALRNLLKNKAYSVINIFGLALGLSCVFLILQYLKHELSYDRFHTNAEDIYRITWEDENPQTRVPHPMAQALVSDFPEVENAVSLTPLWGPGLTKQTFSFHNLEKDIRYDESNVLAVDSTFFKVFSFHILQGDPNTALKKVGGLLISEAMAKKYFGDENPVGKHLAVNDDKRLIEVVAVFEDVPEPSHFHFDFLVSYVTEKASEGDGEFFSWRDFGHYNYVRLKPGTNPNDLEGRLLEWSKKSLDLSPEFYRSLADRKFGFRLQPLTDIHLKSHLRWELEPNGNLDYVYMMTAAALLILIVACVNFINLTTAQSADRAKEIGIRKTLGAFRKQLALQFIGESVLVAALAMVLSSLMIELFMPFFSSFTGRQMNVEYAMYLPGLLGMALIVGLTAGIYPSLYLSSIKPASILKGKFLQSPKGIFARKAFTVFQFVASMVLISSSIIIYSQLSFIKHKELGFDREEVIVVPVKDREAINLRLNELRNELLGIPEIKSVSASSNIPGRPFNQNTIYAARDVQFNVASSEAFVDYDFFKTLGIKFKEGRPFAQENLSDSGVFIINETASNNLKTVVGEELIWDRDGGKIKGSVIGVVNDFHFQSLHEPIRPLIFRLSPRFNYVLLKVSTHDFAETMKAVEASWRKFDNKFGFEFSFLDDDLNKQYGAEEKIGKVLAAFSFIAVAIACFGLLGIAALTFRQKTKEVSVRKVLGASLSSLMIFLAKDFTRLVMISIILAIPLVWWTMDEWLQHFTFHTLINPLVFIGTGVLLLLVAWTTLGYLIIRIASVNPAETLKSE